MKKEFVRRKVLMKTNENIKLPNKKEEYFEYLGMDVKPAWLNSKYPIEIVLYSIKEYKKLLKCKCTEIIERLGSVASTVVLHCVDDPRKSQYYIYICKEYFEMFSDDMKKFVLAHEFYHVKTHCIDINLLNRIEGLDKYGFECDEHNADLYAYFHTGVYPNYMWTLNICRIANMETFKDKDYRKVEKAFKLRAREVNKVLKTIRKEEKRNEKILDRAS